MQLNDAGQMLQSQWEALPERFAHVELDEYVVMLYHFHGILVIKSEGATTKRATTRAAPTNNNAHGDDPALGDIIGAWKSIVTDEYIRGVRQLDWEAFCRKLWQRNYWEHIVRDEPDLNRIREYIICNPGKWESDENHPKNAQSS